MTPQRAVEMLRNMADELKAVARQNDAATEITVLRTIFAADISLIASLLADHIQRSPGPWGPEDEEDEQRESPITEWTAEDDGVCQRCGGVGCEACDARHVLDHCTLVNPLCPDDLCTLEWGHEGTAEGRHALMTMVDLDEVSDLMFMTARGTPRDELMRLANERARELWPDEYKEM